MAQASDFDTNARLSTPPSAFYPFVRDGYKDTIRVTVRETALNGYELYCDIRKPDVSQAVVLNANARVVRHLSPANQYLWSGGDEYQVALRWNGKNDAGGSVAKNAYFRIRITVTPRCYGYDENDDWTFLGYGDTQGLTTPRFKAVSSYRLATRKMVKRGRYASARGATGDCVSYRYGYQSYLSCFGSGSAWATWRFLRPKNSVRWAKKWYWYGYQDGPYRKSAVVSGRAKTVKLRIPGDAWADVYRVKVFYKVRIPI
jgi:hypothetical protein